MQCLGTNCELCKNMRAQLSEDTRSTNTTRTQHDASYRKWRSMGESWSCILQLVIKTKAQFMLCGYPFFTSCFQLNGKLFWVPLILQSMWVIWFVPQSHQICSNGKNLKIISQNHHCNRRIAKWDVEVQYWRDLRESVTIYSSIPKSLVVMLFR